MLRTIVAVMVLVVTATLAFDYYKRNQDRDKLNSVREYWSAALDLAVAEQQSVRDFSSRHSDRTEVISINAYSVLLRETLVVKGLLCSTWSVDVYYTNNSQAAARLSQVTEKYVCL